MAISALGRIKQHYQASGLNSHFHFDNYSFSEYVSKMREIIETTRTDLMLNNAEQIIDANSPYEWIPTDNSAKNTQTGKIKNGILFIHGLFDSPYMMQSMADYYIQKQFLVRGILLPGHGTNPGDLLGVSYQEWLKATRFGIRSFENEVDNLYVCGLSTGAILAMYEANNYSYIKGLIMLSPALRLRRQFAIISAINNLITKTIGGIKWYRAETRNDFAKYQVFTFEPAHQVYLLGNLLREMYYDSKFKCPIFFSLSDDDEVIAPDTSIEFFQQTIEPRNRLLLYSNQEPQFTDPRIMIRSSAYPQENILNFSHIAIPVAPEHPHYGRYTDLIRAVYNLKFGQKDPHLPIMQGALSRENLRHYMIRRLSYNPDFYFMMTQVDQFIESVS